MTVVPATMNGGAKSKTPFEALFHLTISRNLRHACDACALTFCLDVVKGLHQNEICGDIRVILLRF
jgi:hypothetical protein